MLFLLACFVLAYLWCFSTNVLWMRARERKKTKGFFSFSTNNEWNSLDNTKRLNWKTWSYSESKHTSVIKTKLLLWLHSHKKGDERTNYSDCFCYMIFSFYFACLIHCKSILLVNVFVFFHRRTIQAREISWDYCWGGHACVYVCWPWSAR